MKAHTLGDDSHSVGNRIADYQANVARSHSDRSYPLSLAELPLDRCENHLIASTDDGSQLIDDIRRSAAATLRAINLTRWTNKHDQGQLGGEGMIELGRLTMLHGSDAHQLTIIHTATNSIHHHWVKKDAMLQQLQCASCDEPLTLTHLAHCDINATAHTYRTNIRRSVIDHLAQHECTSEWLSVNEHAPIINILTTLFTSTAPFDESLAEQYRRQTQLIVGAFTQRQSNAAAKLLGFDVVESKRIMIDLRLICLQHIHDTYATLKAHTH